MAGIPHAVRRKDAKAEMLVRQDRQQDDQHQAEPELGQGDADEGPGGQEIVEFRILLDRGDDPDWNRDQQRKDVGRPHQQRGVGKPLGDQADGALVAEIGKAEVEVKQVAHVGEVLHEEGLVEAVVGQQAGAIGGRHPRVAQQQVPRFFGQQLEDGEEHERNHEQQGDRLQAAAYDVFDHGPVRRAVTG